MTPQQQQQRDSRVVWFEIPAADMDRACRFYETVLATSLNRGQFPLNAFFMLFGPY